MKRAGAAAGVAIVLIAIGALFLSRFQPAWTILATTGRAAVVAVAVVLGAIAAGTGSLSLLRRNREEPFEIADTLLVGFAVLGTLLGAVAWTGIALEPVVTVITIAGAAAGAYAMLRRRTAVRFAPPAALIVIPLLVAAVEAITPVNSPDELIYKLATAKSYLQYGRMLELPFNSNSYLAMAVQLGDLAALVMGGGIAAKLVHLALFAAALAVTRRLAARLTAHPDFVVAVLAWTPALLIIAGWCWTEWPLIGLLVLSFERYQRWRESGEEGELWIAFAACGAAIACKYTALPWLVAGAALFVWRDRPPVRLLIRGAAIMFMFGAFFYLRNAVWTGSPVAPLLLPAPPAFSHFQQRSGLSDLLHGGYVFNADVTDESAGIVLCAMALLGIGCVASQRRELRELAWIGILQAPPLIAFANGPRNLLSSLVPLAIAGAVIAVEAGRRLVIVVTSVAFAAQAVLVVFVLSSFELGAYLAGGETSQQYIARVRSFAKPYAFISSTTSPRSRILLLGENRTYYLDRESIAGGNLDGPRIASWLARFTTPDALMAEWHRRGITHVVLHRPWYRVASPALRPLAPIEREFVLEVSPEVDRVLKETLKTRAILRYRDDAYLVFELR